MEKFYIFCYQLATLDKTSLGVVFFLEFCGFMGSSLGDVYIDWTTFIFTQKGNNAKMFIAAMSECQG